ALVLVAALGGAAQGFVWSSLSLVGLAVGAVVGGRIAPLLLAGGSHSQYAPVIALAGAVTFALVFELIGSTLGAALRRRERRFLREADSMAGVVAGALIGLVVVWVLGAMALQLPGQTKLRRAAQRSLVLRHLNAIVPPGTLLNALARIDPFPRLAGPPAPTPLADPKYGTAVAIVGYPQNGPFDAVTGRVGSTVTVLTQDAYGRGPVARTVTSLSGDVRHGDSGGAAVDASGAVQASVFAARVNG